MQITGISGRLLSVEWYQVDGTPEPAPEPDGMTRAFSSPEELQTAEKEMLKLLMKAEGRSTEGAAGCMFVSGFLLLLVPVIGWIIGPICILMAIVGGIAPQTAFKVFFSQDYNRLQAVARYAVRNAYFDLKCPACGASWTPLGEAFYFLKNPEGIDCGVCKKRIVRKAGGLVVVP